MKGHQLKHITNYMSITLNFYISLQFWNLNLCISKIFQIQKLTSAVICTEMWLHTLLSLKQIL